MYFQLGLELKLKIKSNLPNKVYKSHFGYASFVFYTSRWQKYKL